MDIYCPVCGEPWDHDSLHDVAGERYGIPFYLNEDDRRNYRRNPSYNSDDYQKFYQAVVKEFQTKGCKAIDPETSWCKPKKNDTTAMAQAAYELLGDDLDGAASMMDDYGRLF
jgi:hypothetical protein